jgi:hypothetical protein
MIDGNEAGTIRDRADLRSRSTELCQKNGPGIAPDL